MTDDATDSNRLIAQRREKLAALREQGTAYPNDFRRDRLAADLHREFGEADAEALEAQPVRVRVAGRMLAKRIMGKASFVRLQDMSGAIQLFVQRDQLPEIGKSTRPNSSHRSLSRMPSSA